MTTPTTDPLTLIRQRQILLKLQLEQKEQAKLERDRPLIEAFAPIREFLEPLEKLRDDQFKGGKNLIVNLGKRSMSLTRNDGDTFSIRAEKRDGKVVFCHYNDETGQFMHKYSLGAVIEFLTDFFARSLKPL